MSLTSENIHKGVYRYTQPDQLVSVKDYLFLRDNGSKYLLLRFSNDMNVPVNAMEFTLTQLDNGGKVLKTDKLSYDGLCFEPGTDYAPEEAIAVLEQCTDFRLQFSRVYSGSYTYHVRGTQINVSYTPDQPAPTPTENPTVRKFSVRPLSLKSKDLMVLCGLEVILLLAMLCLYRFFIPIL